LWLSKLFSRMDSDFEKPEGPARLAGLFKIKSCSQEICGSVACTRYRGKNGQVFPSPEKVTGFEGIQQYELPIIFGVSRHYHFTICVDQHPHWSPVGRTAHHRASTYHRTLFNIFFHFLINLSNFCAIGHTNQRVTNILWMLEIKEHPKKNTKRWWAIVFFKKFEKITLYPSLVQAPYLPHF